VYELTDPHASLASCRPKTASAATCMHGSAVVDEVGLEHVAIGMPVTLRASG
jgi:hypothetical protein